MHRLNIKLKGRRFKIKPHWKIKSEDGWEYYEVPSIDGLKIITKPEWKFYIAFYGKLEPFELEQDKDELQYFPAKNYRFAPSVGISRKEIDGWVHIRTEAGTFKIRWNS